jgi:signal peptidase I
MKLARGILIGLGAAGFSLACLAVLLFNRPTWGWQALSIPTGSMRPHVPPGSLALVHRVPNSTLKVGDVITYTNPLTERGTVTHRIVKTYKIAGRIPAYITKGDANTTPDTLVVGGLVQGKMVWHVPYVGEGLMWAKSWVGIAVLVYLPALVIMLEETRRLASYWAQTKPYRLVPLPKPQRVISLTRLAAASSLLTVLVVAGMSVGWRPAFALGASNTVTLGPNTLTVGRIVPASGSGGNCSSSTNVHINNSSSQTATTGSATSTSGPATSGNASNTTSTSVNVNVTGC